MFSRLRSGLARRLEAIEVLIGLGLVVAGVAMLSVAASLIVAGVGVLAVGALAHVAKPRGS